MWEPLGAWCILYLCCLGQGAKLGLCRKSRSFMFALCYYPSLEFSPDVNFEQFHPPGGTDGHLKLAFYQI
jgi:hypothetical protein